MIKTIKRISIFLGWLVVENYIPSIINLVTLGGMGRKGLENKYTRLWIISKTLLLILLILLFITRSGIVFACLLFLLVYIFFLQDYEKEEWVGWWRRKRDPEYDKKPWYKRHKEV